MNCTRTRAVPATASALLLLLGLAGAHLALADPVVTAQNNLSCAGTRANTYLGCNAKDFTTAVALDSSAATSCTEGEYFLVDAQVSMISGGADRYNIGFFVGEDGNDPQENNAAKLCSVATFPTSPTPWFDGGGPNVCGDFKSKSQSSPTVRQLRLRCTDNGTGNLQVPYVVSWGQNDNATCEGPGNVEAGAQSKCVGGTATVSNVIVKPRPAAYYALDEASWNGTVGEVKDSSGNGLDGRAYNGAATTGSSPAIAGDPGTCRYGSFSNGQLLIPNNDYVQIPHSSTLLGSDALTYAAWVNPQWSLWNLGTQVVMSKSVFPGGAGAAQMGIYAEMGLFNVTLKGRAITSSGNVVEVEAPTAYAYNGWNHVALVFAGNGLTLYVNGSGVDTTAVSTTTLRQNTDPLTIGNDYGRTYYFNGYIDEARVYTDVLTAAQVGAVMAETHPCGAVPTGLHHVRVLHDGNAVSCQAESITVRACADADCSTFYTDGVTGSLTAGGNTVGFVIPAGQYQTVASMHLPSNSALPDPQTVRLGAGGIAPTPSDVTDCHNTTSGAVNDTTACDTAVYQAGFVFDVPHLSSGVAAGTIDVFAVRSSDQTGCIPLFQNVTRDVAFWGNYLNPAAPVAGTPPLLVNGSSIETTTSPAYTSMRSLNFDAGGKATLTSVRYDDVGLMQLSARYEGSDTHTPADGGMIVLGSDSFVVKPHHFALTAITCADGTANPAATAASGGAFCRAGQAFDVTVTAMNSFGDATTNFGREAMPEGVKLTASLVSGLGLTSSPGLNNDTAFGSFTNGVASGTIFNWPEVGIIALTPTVADADYLGAGNVSGTAASHVGRFYPSDFIVAHTPAAACSGAFTYAGLAAPVAKLGQPFTVTGTVTARNAAGGTTANYAGDFARLAVGDIDAAPMQGGVAAAGTLTWNVNSLLFATGVGDFSATGLYAFTAEGGPQDMYLHVNANDGEASGEENDSGKAVEYRLGRLRLQNAYGTELTNITVPLQAEYYDAAGFYRLNDADSCTALIQANHLQLRNAQTDSGNWQSGDSTMIIGDGSTVALPINSPLSSGDAGLTFTAPGANNTGYVDIRTALAAAYPWLAYPWNCDAAAPNEACAQVNFGLFGGSPRHIYLREQY